MRHTFLVFILALININAFAQRGNPYYQDFVVSGNKIYLLNNGIIQVYSSKAEKIDYSNPLQIEIKSISLDHLKNVVCVDKQNVVRRLNIDNSWSVVKTSLNAIYATGFNSNNHCFLITDVGITDITENKTYIPDSSFYRSDWGGFNVKNRWLNESNSTIPIFIDSHNNLWTIFYHGEWGADMFIFDTIQKRFLKFDNVVAMPGFEYQENILSPVWSFNSYKVAKYERKVTTDSMYYNGSIVFDLEMDDTFSKRSFALNETFGFTDCVFNPLDGYIYAISKRGLYKADPKKSVNKGSDWQKVNSFKTPVAKETALFGKGKKTTLQPQYISKIRFTESGNLALLSPGGWLAIFDGKKLMLVN